MFAVIAPALMTGAFADRVNFGPYMVFLNTLGTLGIFPGLPLMGRWLDGQTRRLGFAGGIVIHVTAGFSALATVVCVTVETPLGRKRGE